MPIRNPFARRSGPVAQDENLPPNIQTMAHPGFERVDTVGSKASSSLSIKSIKSYDTGEYKMSVVNDSGIYLPPSPTDEIAVWPRRYLSRNSSDTKSSSGDIEHFSISRESFDSYRRSFDISAKSPVLGHDFPSRQSLDSARFPRPPRSLLDRRVSPELPTAQEDFEEVGLDDSRHAQQQQPPQQQQPAPHRRRGFFSKLTESHDKDAASTGTAMPRFLMSGRKRAQSGSGQGSELGTIERPQTAAAVEVQEVH